MPVVELTLAPAMPYHQISFEESSQESKLQGVLCIFGFVAAARAFRAKQAQLVRSAAAEHDIILFFTFAIEV